MLDAKTGMLLWASETLTLALLLGTLWLHRPARRHNIYFAAGFAATSAGTVMVALRGDIPNFLSIEVGNTLALSAFSFWLAGLLSFEQRKTAGWIAIPPLLWVAGMLIGPVRENMVPRILLYHICAATGYFMLAGILLASKARASFSRKVLAATFILQAFCGALVASIVIPSTPPPQRHSADGSARLFRHSRLYHHRHDERQDHHGRHGNPPAPAGHDRPPDRRPQPARAA